MRICGSGRSSSGAEIAGAARGDADVQPRERGFRLGVACVVDVQGAGAESVSCAGNSRATRHRGRRSGG
jgi:hypothetical protein